MLYLEVKRFIEIVSKNDTFSDDRCMVSWRSVTIRLQYGKKCNLLVRYVFSTYDKEDNGYPHDGRADKNPYRHDRRAHKDSYPHDSNNQCIILRLQLSFAIINVQLMLV